ncbi:insulinase-like peptidase [Cryptosporidium ubiquitum]|uniref:Insulinase-like peptidase n=1 Tax=Cryptosporidium ubiquitum TaxID=857276 RepID=A0A1J4MEQ2_9CRYT|nr:insulinase-like peptidase [Cryptosporidium ubiquitum]OII72722.1 insulinase-like peptidase [Cryptosporidium ubiquitum]
MILDNVDPTNLVRKFTLPNKLEVLIISGSDKLSSSVSFGLNVGSFFDPKEYLGFSKILGCIFQYIQVDGKYFTKLVDSIRKDNLTCITYYWIPQSSETTIEFSGVFSSECLDEYLGRIRNSLEVMDYSDEIITKCLGKLRKEYEHEINSGTTQRKALLKSIFESGLKGSLKKDKDYVISELVAEIKKFKRNYFSSNIMKLIIESSLSFDYLVKLVTKHFSTIPNLETDIRKMSYNLALSNLHTEGLSGNLVEYKGNNNKISFMFVFDSEKGALLGSNRMPLFEHLVKYYFCGDFSGSLRNAVSPLTLTCKVEYFAERLAFVLLEVESEGINIVFEETLELVYSSVVLLRKTKIESDYLEFLMNHCIANYMNYNLFDYKLNIRDRISSWIDYNVWNKLERFCKDKRLTLEVFNQLLTFLDIDNLLIFLNSKQFSYSLNSHYEDYEDQIKYNDDYLEYGTDLSENIGKNTSIYFSSLGNDENLGKYNKNKTTDQDERYFYNCEGIFFKVKYNFLKIPRRLVNRLKNTKESFGLINGLSRPFINPYTPKDFKLVDFVWEDFPNTRMAVKNMGIEVISNPFAETNVEIYPSKYLLSGVRGIFTNQITQEHHLAISKYHDTQISLLDNINIWYKARNYKRQPYFRGILRLSSPYKSFKIINLILTFILAISMKIMLNFSLLKDAKLSLSPKNTPEYSSVFPSLDFDMSGYSSSLYPLLKTISTSLNSEEIISETFSYDSMRAYERKLINKKKSMTSELKAKELSLRITIPNYPTLARQFFGLSQTNRKQLFDEFNKFKENLCIDGLFVGNLDRIELEESLKDFSSMFGSKATNVQCLKLFKRRSFPIKDVRGTIYKKMIYHYVRPDSSIFYDTYINSNNENKEIKKYNSTVSIENLFKFLNEECGHIDITNSTIESGYLGFETSSNEFGPNVALLDIIIYKNTQNLDSDDIGILYLNDAYYNIIWFKESLKITKASLSLKTSIQKFDSYYKWSIQLDSWEYSANDLGLYISELTNVYQNKLIWTFKEDYDMIKNLTISKLKNGLIKRNIDEEFNSHKFNIGYSDSIIKELDKLNFFDFTNKMSNILRDNTLFLLVQVQSTSLNNKFFNIKSRNLKSNNKNHNRLEMTKNGMISIPSGYKYIKHIDELVLDDRIPTTPLDFDDDGLL